MIAASRMKPEVNNGTWNRIARKHHRHASGIEVRYDFNRCMWEIIGGVSDGLRYERLWVAQHVATK